MWHRNAMVALYAAVAKARKQVRQFEKRSNVNYETKRSDVVDFDFADLATVMEAVTDALSDQGLFTTFLPDGAMLYGWLVHQEGGAMRCRRPVRADVAPEDYSSQLTKLRRYATCAILSIAPHESGERTAAADGAAPRTRRKRNEPAGTADGNGSGSPSAGPATAAKTRKPSGPRPAGSARQSQPEPAADPNDWQRADTADAREIRERLGKLPSGEVAALRREHGNDPKRLLAKCRKAGNAAKGREQAGAGRPEDRGTQAERIENGFEKLGMSGQERQALRTEYAGRPKELFEHLSTLYEKRRAREGR